MTGGEDMGEGLTYLAASGWPHGKTPRQSRLRCDPARSRPGTQHGPGQKGLCAMCLGYGGPC